MSSSSFEVRSAAQNGVLPNDRRRAPRYEVHIPVEVSTTDGVIFSSEMLNVSTSGFRARSAMILASGTRLVVRFGQGMPRRAQVAWQRGDEVGCHFLRPLSQKQLAALAGE